MSLLSSIGTASRALQLFSGALGAHQTNVSNSATAGFAALRVSVPAVGSTDGVISDSVQISSTGDPRGDALVQAASSHASQSSTTANQLEPVNQLFDITGASGILAALNQFSTAFANLAVTPNDTVQRAAALSAADNVALSFGRVSSTLDTLRVSTDSGIVSTVASINQIAGQIRHYNTAIRGQTQPDPGADAGLRSSLDQLAALTDITVSRNQDGTVSVLTGGQQPLVLGDQLYTLTADPSAAPGSQIASSGGGGFLSRGGQLGALLAFRNETLQALQGGNGVTGALNDLAAGFASRVNALLTTGVTASRAPGSPLFSFDSTDSTNAARTLARDTGITADLLALATPGSPGQANGVASALAALTSSRQPADQIGGQSVQDLFASIAATVGQHLSDARTQSQTDLTALTSAQVNRQQSSGVSLDSEAVAITAYQRSYEAAAKLISILDQLTADAVNLIK